LLTWTTRALPPLTAGRQRHTGVRLSDGRVALIGGRAGSAAPPSDGAAVVSLGDVTVLDLETGTLASWPGLASPREGALAWDLEGALVVTGGMAHTGMEPIEDETESYGYREDDGAARFPVQHESRRQPRSWGIGAANTRVGEHFVLSGGMCFDAGAFVYFSAVRRLDPQTLDWIACGALAIPRYLHGAAAVSATELLVTGGLRSDDDTESKLEELDATEIVELGGTTRRGPPLPFAAAEPLVATRRRARPGRRGLRRELPGSGGGVR